MKRREALACAVGILLLVSAWGGLPTETASAQLPGQNPVLSFTMEAEPAYASFGRSGSQSGPFPNVVEYKLHITDTSVDGFDPSGADNRVSHQFIVEFPAWRHNRTPHGWAFDSPTPSAFTLTSGQSQTVTLPVKVEITAQDIFAELVVHVMILQPQLQLRETQSIILAGRIMPEPGVNLLLDLSDTKPRYRPGETVTIPVRVTNTDLYPHAIAVRPSFADGRNPASLGMAGGGDYHLLPLETRTINVTFIAPQEKFWYSYESLGFQVEAWVVQSPDMRKITSNPVMVHGLNPDTPYLVAMAAALLLLLLLLAFLLLARRHYQERVVGKPIPPWKIPAEAARLERLKRESPRRFYVERYFLMEEEYLSALLWFHTYKRKSRRQFKHARRSMRYEHKAKRLAAFDDNGFDRRAERWKGWYAWRIRRRERWLTRRVARLERKVEQGHEKEFAKAHKKWEQKVEALRAKANKPILKERKRWEAKKAKMEDAWEDEVAKLQGRHEKERAAVAEAHEKQVRKEDKAAWKAWKQAVAETQKENKVLKAEGKEPLPLPELRSDAVPEPEWPAPPDLPTRPKLPPAPKLVEPEGMPPEPKPAAPTLETSRLNKKAVRARRKAAKRIAKLERRLAKRLAKVERKRAKRAFKNVQKRNRYVRESEEAFRPTLTERVFGLTPEAHERRARKQLVKALHKDELEHFKESEASRLDRLKAEARRQEAEMEARLIRRRAEVRTAAAPAGKAVSASAARQVEALEADLEALRGKNQARFEQAASEAEARIRAEDERLWKALEAPPEADAPAPEAAAKASKATSGRTR